MLADVAIEDESLEVVVGVVEVVVVEATAAAAWAVAA